MRGFRESCVSAALLNERVQIEEFERPEPEEWWWFWLRRYPELQPEAEEVWKDELDPPRGWGTRRPLPAEV